MFDLLVIGGQVGALYPEKVIFDVAGLPAVTGQDLGAALGEQAASANPAYLLSQPGVPPWPPRRGAHGLRAHVTVTSHRGLDVETRPC